MHAFFVCVTCFTCVCIHVAFLLKMCGRKGEQEQGLALLIDSGRLKDKEHARCFAQRMKLFFPLSGLR